MTFFVSYLIILNIISLVFSIASPQATRKDERIILGLIFWEDLSYRIVFHALYRSVHALRGLVKEVKGKRKDDSEL